MWTALAILVLAQPEAVPAKQPAPKPPAKQAADLAAAVRLEAAGKIIDTDIGHAAAFVGDFYGDGSRALLVGQFGDGILWVHRDQGSKTQPKFGERVKFHGSVPTG